MSVRWLRPLVLFALALGSFAITWSSAVYFNADEYAPFVMEKLELPLPNEERYLSALEYHVISVAFAFPACLLLLSRRIMRRIPRVHRWLGRITGAITIFVLVPSGFYLSLFAKGGLLGTAGFMLSGAIVVVAMVLAVREARARRYTSHRRFVLHVVAQMAVAVISRAMLFAADAAAFDHDTSYLVSLWVPVIGCAALVEWLAGPRPRPRPRPRTLPWRNHAQSSTRRRHPGSHVEPGFSRL